jgi:hypothetical protein
MLVGQTGAGDLLTSYETAFTRDFGTRPH